MSLFVGAAKRLALRLSTKLYRDLSQGAGAALGAILRRSERQAVEGLNLRPLPSWWRPEAGGKGGEG